MANFARGKRLPRSKFATEKFATAVWEKLPEAPLIVLRGFPSARSLAVGRSGEGRGGQEHGGAREAPARGGAKAEGVRAGDVAFSRQVVSINLFLDSLDVET